jgi:hypothetical protein
MRMLMTFVLVLAVAGPAWAQERCDENLLGVYFDPLGDTFCQEWVPLYTPFPMYAVLTDPTVPEISGFEFGMETPPGLTLLAVQTLCNPFWDPIENIPYVVGCGSPVPVSQATVLVQFQFMALGTATEPIHFLVHGSEYPTLPSGVPALWLPDGQALPLHIRGGPDGPTAMLFADCTVDTEPATWGAVKATYR